MAMCSAGLSISKENWKAITAKRIWSALANNGAKAWWSIMELGRWHRAKPRGPRSPGKFREKPRAGGGISSHLNISFIYSSTEHWHVCVPVCVHVQVLLWGPGRVTCITKRTLLCVYILRGYIRWFSRWKAQETIQPYFLFQLQSGIDIFTY